MADELDGKLRHVGGKIQEGIGDLRYWRHSEVRLKD